MAKKTTEVKQDPLLEEIATVKRLLVLFLMKTGASQDEIALALKVDRSQISRMIPSSKVKKYEDYS